MSAKHPIRDRYAEPGYQWWFAWHPVKMPDGRWAWLRWVTRCRVGMPSKSAPAAAHRRIAAQSRIAARSRRAPAERGRA